MKKLAFIIVVALLSAPVLRADVNFEFQYLDVGTGFNDPVDGPARRIALDQAADQFATAFAAYDAEIVIEVVGSSPDGSLSSATASLVGTATSAGFGTHEVVLNKVLSNGETDLNDEAVDGTLAINFGQLWQLDPTVTPSESQYDFQAAVYHELTHLMGFGSGIFTRGGLFAGDHLGRTTGEWSKFDQFLSDAEGNALITGVTLNKPAYHSLLVGGASPDGGLFFNGSAGLIGLYTPTTFAAGSSGSHLDIDNPAYADGLMVPRVSTGPGPRQFLEIELAMLRDIGYAEIDQIAAVPEASAWTMLSLACLLLTSHLRRRR